MKKGVKSVEPLVNDFYSNQLREYNLVYKLQQDKLNPEIDAALEKYSSKNGGLGGNRPDCKLLLRDKTLKDYPIIIEYKGYKGKLVKLDKNNNVKNKTSENEPDFKNISEYAVNGSIHYANALLHYTIYDEIISIGITGYKNECNELITEIGVYIVSKENFGLGQKVGNYTDLSFLKKENFDKFINTIHELSLTDEEREKLKNIRESEISNQLIKLNNDIYKDEAGLSERDRIYLVTATIMATLGIPDKVAPLEKSDLKSKWEPGKRDGDIIITTIENFLKEKKLPQDKKEQIINALKTVLLSNNINKPNNGTSRLKNIFSKVVDDLGFYYKMGLTTDFTGKLFNEMYSWLGFSEDEQNDVVLTPPYVAQLLVKLAKINKDSYVWDFATGSAGLLVSAMNEMINDAKSKIQSYDELQQKITKIKTEQLLGIELLAEIYMLAVLNMILMGDGSSNILNGNSLLLNSNDELDEAGKFPANALVLNPPYSAKGNGMIFVKKAFSLMKNWYGAIIIQNSAGSGQAKEINQEILKNNTLIASIKMPRDLFIGKSSVQTYIYVFRVNEPHQKDYDVKFIDFSNDGYQRLDRKKSKVKLKNIDHAKERYQEVVDLVWFGRQKLHFFNENEYFEGHIDPLNGSDWNQTKPIDANPKIVDFKKTVADYLAWEVSNILKKEGGQQLKKIDSTVNEKFKDINWGEFKLGNLFEKIKTNKVIRDTNGTLPATTAQLSNNQLGAVVNKKHATILKNVISLTANGTGKAFYQPYEFTVLQDSYALKLKNNDAIDPKIGTFLVTVINKVLHKYEWTNKSSWEKVKDEIIFLPITFDNKPDWEYMKKFITELQAERYGELQAYLKAAGLKDNTLTYREREREHSKLK